MGKGIYRCRLLESPKTHLLAYLDFEKVASYSLSLNFLRLD